MPETVKDLSVLCLQRKVSQSIIFFTGDGPVEVTVQAIGNAKVRLAITAPAAINVMRGELAGQDPTRSSYPRVPEVASLEKTSV